MQGKIKKIPKNNMGEEKIEVGEKIKVDEEIEVEHEIERRQGNGEMKINIEKLESAPKKKKKLKKN